MEQSIITAVKLKGSEGKLLRSKVTVTPFWLLTKIIGPHVGHPSEVIAPDLKRRRELTPEQGQHRTVVVER